MRQSLTALLTFCFLCACAGSGATRKLRPLPTADHPALAPQEAGLPNVIAAPSSLSAPPRAGQRATPPPAAGASPPPAGAAPRSGSDAPAASQAGAPANARAHVSTQTASAESPETTDATTQRHDGMAAAPADAGVATPNASGAAPPGASAAAPAGAAGAGPLAMAADPFAPSNDAPAQSGAMNLPLMSGVGHDQVDKLLEDRLDVTAYRVQVSKTKDFGKPLFDRVYDVMEDINLFDEFQSAGVMIDSDAYWVRIALIDLLDREENFTKPRLYGLDKKRKDAP